MKKLIPLTLLALSSTGVLAQPYLGVQFGVAGLSDTNDIFDSAIAHRNIGRVFAGYMQEEANSIPTSRFGIELGYEKMHDLKSAVNTLRFKRHGFDALAVIDYAMNEQFDIFGKVGAAFITQKLQKPGATLVSSTTTAPKVELGLGVEVLPHTKLTASVSQEFKNGHHRNSQTSSLIGLSYWF